MDCMVHLRSKTAQFSIYNCNAHVESADAEDDADDYPNGIRYSHQVNLQTLADGEAESDSDACRVEESHLFTSHIT